MRTITQNTYTFNELPEEVKEKAIENYRENSDDFEFVKESVIDDVKEIAELIGINISNIYFTGFYRQGDGACFEGYYNYKKGSVKSLKTYAPLDNELHRIVEGLQRIQKNNFYQLRAYVEHKGRYYHSNCTVISVENELDKYISSTIEDEVKELLRDFMDWIYTRLNNEYDYTMKDEYIIESIECNEYEFTSDGILVQ